MGIQDSANRIKNNVAAAYAAAAEKGADIPETANSDNLAETIRSIHDTVSADNVYFSDGETVQQKYDNGELAGPAGGGIVQKVEFTDRQSAWNWLSVNYKKLISARLLQENVSFDTGQLYHPVVIAQSDISCVEFDATTMNGTSIQMSGFRLYSDRMTQTATVVTMNTSTNMVSINDSEYTVEDSTWETHMMKLIIYYDGGDASSHVFELTYEDDTTETLTLYGG